ncbi:hypothetical protein FHS14_003674 [Paenibacillus baekrokdamisoli]|nr:hypothetical protein [Paenibacillus baekrokdamisoli]
MLEVMVSQLIWKVTVVHLMLLIIVDIWNINILRIVTNPTLVYAFSTCSR